MGDEIQYIFDNKFAEDYFDNFYEQEKSTDREYSFGYFQKMFRRTTLGKKYSNDFIAEQYATIMEATDGQTRGRSLFNYFKRRLPHTYAHLGRVYFDGGNIVLSSGCLMAYEAEVAALEQKKEKKYPCFEVRSPSEFMSNGLSNRSN